MTALGSAWGHGLETVSSGGSVLDVWYPEPSGGSPASDARQAPADLTALEGFDEQRGVQLRTVLTAVDDLESPPADPADVYLRLHLLSHRLVRPNELNLDGIFDLLTTTVWTNHGPCAAEGFDTLRARLRARSAPVLVHSVDKIPRMTDYVVPSRVRVADADRVRLGAHLAEGTTVMQEGFVNFNAGTLGVSMVEGRISAGVVVDDGSDIGGGASIMGTLSGGGRERIRVGRRCLIGANAGIGISLGDDCIVEAGCYVTAGAKITLANGRVVKALELSGRSDLLFRRNSVTGALEVVPRAGGPIELNPSLHGNTLGAGETPEPLRELLRPVLAGHAPAVVPAVAPREQPLEVGPGRLRELSGLVRHSLPHLAMMWGDQLLAPGPRRCPRLARAHGRHEPSGRLQLGRLVVVPHKPLEPRTAVHAPMATSSIERWRSSQAPERARQANAQSGRGSVDAGVMGGPSSGPAVGGDMASRAQPRIAYSTIRVTKSARSTAQRP